MDSLTLTCRELVELVTDYFEGRLSPIQRVRFERHLAGCEDCSAYIMQLRQTIRLTGALTEETISPQARDELLVLFRGWRRGAAR